jgi:hypothetical protein
MQTLRENNQLRNNLKLREYNRNRFKGDDTRISLLGKNGLGSAGTQINFFALNAKLAAFNSPFPCGVREISCPV